MAKLPDPSLFNLIRSLDSAEKRYFRTYAIQRDGDNYLELFERIEKRKEYDEKEIIGEGKYKTINQFRKQKALLYKNILKSLVDFYEEKMEDIKINGMISAAKILFLKSLRKESRNLLENAKKIAIKNEYLLPRIGIMILESRLSASGNFRGRDLDYNDIQLSAIKTHIEKLINLEEYRHLTGKLLHLHARYHKPREPLQTEIFRELKEHPLLLDSRNAKTVLSEYLFLFFQNTYSRIMGSTEKAYEYSNQIISFMKRNPGIFMTEEYIYLYISQLFNNINAANELKKTNASLNQINVIRRLIASFDISPLYKSYFRFVLCRTYIFEANIYLSTFRLHEYEKILPELLRIIRTREPVPVGDKHLLLTELCNYFIYSGDFSKALYWQSQFFNDTLARESGDLYAISMIIRLIIFYESEELSSLESSIRSAYRFLVKNKKMYKTENIIMNFIRKSLFRTLTLLELTNAFKELRKELEILRNDPYEKQVFDYFEFIAWLDSKIQNKPLTEILAGLRKER